MFRIRNSKTMCPIFEIETDYFCDNEAEIEEYIYAEDFFSDYILDAIDEYAPHYRSRGFFCEEEAYTLVKEMVERYFNYRCSGIEILSEEINGDGQVIRSFTIKGWEIYRRLLEKLLSDVGADLYVGKLIEKQLFSFAQKGIWHVCLMLPNGDLIYDVALVPYPQIIDNSYVWKIDDKELVPVLWYGRYDSNSIKRWSITKKNTDKDIQFWLEEDQWMLMKSLGDFSDIFLDWYLGECDYYVPEMEQIRESCIVDFSEEDTIESLMDKVNDILIQRKKDQDKAIELKKTKETIAESGRFKIEAFNNSGYCPYEQYWEDVPSNASATYDNLEDAVDAFLHAVITNYDVNCECLYYYLTEWGFTEEDIMQMLEAKECSAGIRLFYDGEEELELLSNWRVYNTLTYTLLNSKEILFGDGEAALIDRIKILLLKKNIIGGSYGEGIYSFFVENSNQ